VEPREKRRTKYLLSNLFCQVIELGEGESSPSGDGVVEHDTSAASPVSAPPARVYKTPKRKAKIGRYKGSSAKQRKRTVPVLLSPNPNNNPQAASVTTARVPSSGAKRKWTTKDLKKELSTAQRKLNEETTKRERQEKGRKKEQQKSKALGIRLGCCITEKRVVEVLLKKTVKKNVSIMNENEVNIEVVFICHC